jgi:glutamate synthase (NADPH/NADH) large chain
MFVVDLEAGRIISDEELKKSICSQKPYGEWLNKYKIRLEELPEPRVLFTHLESDAVFKYQKAFGYSTEDLETIIAPMALDGKEPIGSMGTDVPLAVLSDQPQHLSSYFKQLFAQVTNPPIDPIRERLVMSLATFVGNNGNLLVEDPLDCHSVALQHPVLTNHELETIRSIDTGIFQAKTLQTYFRADGKAGSLKKGLDRLCRYAVDAVEDGFEVLILSDRAIDSDHAPIPSLLAVSAVHHHLIAKALRGQVGLIVEAGDVWEVHHFACLIGFWRHRHQSLSRAFTIRDMKMNRKLDTAQDVEYLKKNYIKACAMPAEGISKMGISTLQSYQGAQIFEILASIKVWWIVILPVPPLVYKVWALMKLQRDSGKHRLAYSKKELPVEQLPVGGVYQWKRKAKCTCSIPTTIHLLQYSYAHGRTMLLLKSTASGKRAKRKSLYPALLF